MRNLILCCAALAACDDGSDAADAALGLDSALTDAAIDSGPIDARPPTDAIDLGVDAAPNPLPLAPAAIMAGCETSCAGLAECSGQAQPTCVADCVARASANGWWLGSYGCAEESCDTETCLAEPVVPSEACTAPCERVEACDLFSLVRVPEGAPGACLALCSGSVAANPAVEAVLACIAESFAEDCAEPTERVQACFGQGGLCEGFCDDLVGPQEQDCALDSPLRQAWPDPQTCEAACDAVGPGQAPTLAGCVFVSDCGDPAECLPPAAPDPACSEVCEAIATACEPLPYPSTDFCTALCTGLLQGLGVPEGAPGAGACFMELGGCPPDDDAPGGAMLGCVLPQGLGCANRSRDPILTGGGRRFGECLGECSFQIEVEPAEGCDQVRLEVCAYGGGGCPRSNLGMLTEAGHTRVRALAAELAEVELSPRYGCPDCADGGSGLLRLRRRGELTEHEYEFGNPPPELAAAAAWAQGLVDALNSCVSNADVVVAPDCQPPAR